jgi:hypothetical protein
MTKSKAQTLLAAGYALAVIGLIAGASSDVFHPDPVVAFFFAGYVFWSTYLGWFIVYRPMQDFFSNIFIFRENTVSLILAYIMLKITVLWFTLIFAMIVGSFGGAIYKQIQWSKIAYT